METKRNPIFDILKIVASFLVIVNHTINIPEVITFGVDAATLSGLLAAFFTSKVAVGIFFAVSGALLIPKIESFSVVYRQRVLKILTVLVLASLFYYCFQLYEYQSLRDFSLFYFFRTIISEPFRVPLWFLYTFAGLLICLPFIRVLCQSMSRKEHLIFCGLCIFFGSFIPTLETMSGISVSPLLQYGYFSMTLGYFILGHLIFNLMPTRTFRRSYAVFAAITMIVCVGISVAFTRNDPAFINGSLIRLDDRNGLFTAVSVIATLVISQWFANKATFACRTRMVFKTLANATLMTYLIHEFVLIKLRPLYILSTNILSPWSALLLHQILVFAISTLFGLFLQYLLNKRRHQSHHS
ncbi:acyltransferase family protein [Erysipelothrix sp. HDW6C]|uniref:acyltransferase n=1 Tax=Erysipelothrix sp. HDW6C TaxID=2714930 RepID=UPI00140C25F9|nr:acyltransferase family protein [Erysipelothrix sp. HDW6C]QIK69206.1 acyltransferase family protein [Erysipelothrix sp. HDW6C]